jgi:sugar O-acyltransferase (sialic acid O-acetyltransferase NeuD family)
VKKRIVIIGAGGQARETEWIVRDIDGAGGDLECRGFVVSDLSRLDVHDSKDRVLGDYSWLREHRAEFDALAIGIGSPASRCRVARDLIGDFPAEMWPPLIHPSAVFDRQSCILGHGTLISAGVVMTVNIRLEPFSMANFGAMIGHEATIGFGSVVNPGVNISGGVTIGEGSLIGTGAQVLQYLTIGNRATVGAGAVVLHDVGDETTVVGMPARAVK